MTERKVPPISIHKTLQGQLQINWQDKYQNEYYCPKCQETKLSGFKYAKPRTCKLVLYCQSCKEYVGLTCRLKAYIFGYAPNLECPNPLCTELGHNGQKGWIYLISSKKNRYRCHFCKINFNPELNGYNSWTYTPKGCKLLSFSFEEDIWDLRHFYDLARKRTINFKDVNPQWYRTEVKYYIEYLLKAHRFDSPDSIIGLVSTLKQFGRIVIHQNLNNKFDINRNSIIIFLDNCKTNTNTTINEKLYLLRSFFDWLDLEKSYLIRSRDFLKRNNNDPDWLDEITRRAIKQHLHKIPEPIARHYLVQLYIAARPQDVYKLHFDCLVEENSKWYINFFQSKKKRWHKILASRKIRKVIEEQQQWIGENLGENYNYLFCHLRGILTRSYPDFPAMRPLPEVPRAEHNPMIRVIRMLIDNENILDANGQKPHFIGRITRHSRLQEVRTKYGMEAARLYADHQSSNTTFQHYAPPTREQVAEVDLPFQELLMNPDNKFLPWQSLPESLLQNPKAHELDLEIAPRLVVYGHCALDPKTPCPVNLFPKCYGCSSFRPSTGKLPFYERQYQGEQQRLAEAEKVGAELAQEEAKATIEAMDKWLPELRRLANG